MQNDMAIGICGLNELPTMFLSSLNSSSQKDMFCDLFSLEFGFRADSRYTGSKASVECVEEERRWKTEEEQSVQSHPRSELVKKLVQLHKSTCSERSVVTR
jgi:hypothetical protein